MKGTHGDISQNTCSLAVGASDHDVVTYSGAKTHQKFGTYPCMPTPELVTQRDKSSAREKNNKIK